MTNIVALDIGRVCVNLEFDRCARRFGYDTLEGLMADWPEIVEKLELFETGRLDADGFLEVLEPLAPGRARQELVGYYHDLIGDEIGGMAEQVDRMLSCGLRIVFFSDISTLHLTGARELISFADRIPDEIVSFRSGARKPASPMYEDLEREFCGGDVPCLYLDDKLCNIEAGRARGWNSVQVHAIGDVVLALDSLLQ